MRCYFNPRRRAHTYSIHVQHQEMYNLQSFISGIRLGVGAFISPLTDRVVAKSGLGGGPRAPTPRGYGVVAGVRFKIHQSDDKSSYDIHMHVLKRSGVLAYARRQTKV